MRDLENGADVLLDACRILVGKYRHGLEVLTVNADCKISRIYAEVQVSSASERGIRNSLNILDIVAEVGLDISYGTDLAGLDPLYHLLVKGCERCPHSLAHEHASVLSLSEDAVSFLAAHYERLFDEYIHVVLDAHDRVLVVERIGCGDVYKIDILLAGHLLVRAQRLGIGAVLLNELIGTCLLS